MTHTEIMTLCQALKLEFRQIPATSGRQFEATAPRVRVYWKTSALGNLLGLPRVNGRTWDSHARSLKEIEYLVDQAR